MNTKVMHITNLLHLIRSVELKKTLDRLADQVSAHSNRGRPDPGEPGPLDLISLVRYHAEHRTRADIFYDNLESEKLNKRIFKRASSIRKWAETQRKTLESVQGLWIYRALFYLINATARLSGRKGRMNPAKHALEGLTQFRSDFNLMMDEMSLLSLKRSDNIPLNPYLFDALRNRQTGRVSVIVVHDQNSESLQRLIKSIEQHNTYDPVEVIIAGRNLSPAELEHLRELAPGLQMVDAGTDMQCTPAYARNLAAEKSTGAYLLFLDSSVSFTQDAIGSFVRALDSDPGAGIAGPVIRSGDHGQSTCGAIRFELVRKEIDSEALTPLAHPSIFHESATRPYQEMTDEQPGRGKSAVAFFNPAESRPPEAPGNPRTPSIDGRALFCRADEFFRAGGFDLNYAGGMENVDLCLKFKTLSGKDTIIVKEVAMVAGDNSDLSYLNRKDDEYFYHDAGILRNRFGYLLKAMNPESLTGAAPEVKFRIAIKLPMISGEESKFWGDYHFAVSLKNALESLGHPTRLDMFDEWYRHDFTRDDLVVVIRGNRRYYPLGAHINMIWNISNPGIMNPSEFSEYDHVFVASTRFAEKMKSLVRKPVEALLQCTDPSLFYPETDPDPNFGAGVLFVGNTRGVRRKALEYALKKEIAVDVYGKGWQEYLPAEYIKGSFIENHELRKYYSNCKILLNDHWDDMAESGFVSNRIFDALACGAVILTDRVNDFGEELAGGVNFYDSAGELAEQIRYIRDHYSEARARASRAGKIVLERHTFLCRAERIIGAARKAHREKIAADGSAGGRLSDIHE